MAVKPALEPLVVSLSTPGMTPLLRSGLGGLAASLHAVAVAEGVRWPLTGRCEVPLGPGSASVEAHQVTIDWGGKPAETLEALVGSSFRITREGVVDLPGTRQAEQPLPLGVSLQDALKRTFLQHGKTTQKRGALKTVTREIDEVSHTLSYQPYSTYAHRETATDSLLAALKKGHVDLAGWAYPGAAVRHTAFAQTSIGYSPPLALAAFFSIVGTISLQAPGRAGVLVLLVPSSLLSFGAYRHLLTPRSVKEVMVAGPSDAVLTASVELRSKNFKVPFVASIEAVLLRATAWDSKQKYRVATVSASGLSAEQLRLFESASRLLPTRLVSLKKAKKAETDFFASPSVLREFVAHNLARGRPWFDGFATARAEGDRYLHYYRRADNKGALQAREREGLIVMNESLKEAEAALVRSVHVAMRQRFGAISEETKGMAANARNKRFDNEREKWRLAFAQSKTHEQVRAALADLWSRAGSNAELKAKWEVVLPMLREDAWQAARDLALLALASYRGAGVEENSKEEGEG